MKKTQTVLWPFWLEVALTAIIPFAIWWSITPTNILNSGPIWKLLETIGICGSTLIFFAGIPAGIIGIWAAKKTEKQKIATIVLSIVNLFAGIIEVGTLLLVLCGVLFGGFSV